VAAAWPENGLGGQGKARLGGMRAAVALPLVAVQLPTVRSRAASLHQPGEAGA